MSHRISIEDAKQKFEHENEIQALNKKGDYHSTRFERRKQKRLQHESSWFDYIKSRGGIKEKKKDATGTKEKDLDTPERKEVQ